MILKRWLLRSLFTLLSVVFGIAIYLNLQLIIHPSEIPSIFGYKLLIVTSGSMSPVFEAEDVIIIRERAPEKMKEQDIITYRLKDDRVITHRVIDIFGSVNNLVLQTKGDANGIKDQYQVSSEMVEGRYLFKIPHFGQIAGYFSHPIGSLILVILLMTVYGLVFKSLGYNKRRQTISI